MARPVQLLPSLKTRYEKVPDPLTISILCPGLNRSLIGSLRAESHFLISFSAASRLLFSSSGDLVCIPWGPNSSAAVAWLRISDLAVSLLRAEDTLAGIWLRLQLSSVCLRCRSTPSSQLLRDSVRSVYIGGCYRRPWLVPGNSSVLAL